MKVGLLGIALLALWLVAILVFSQVQMRDERARGIQSTLRHGQEQVHLLALALPSPLTPPAANAFLRELGSRIGRGNVAYIAVHAPDGNTIGRYDPSGRESAVPLQHRQNSLASQGFMSQQIPSAYGQAPLYEFARPILDGATLSGRVRLGLSVPVTPFLSPRRLSVNALIVFFLIATAVIGYYLVGVAARQLRTQDRSGRPGGGGPAAPAGGILPLVQQLDHDINELSAHLRKEQVRTRSLTTQLGVATFLQRKALSVLDSLDAGVLILDNQDEVTHLNLTAAGWIGATHADAVGRPVEQIMPLKELDQLLAQEGLHTPTHAGQTVNITDPPWAPGDTYKLALIPLRDGSTEPCGRVLLIENVSRERQIHDAQETFIARLAHELRQPMTALIGYSDLLMSGNVVDVERQKEFYNTINTEARRLSGLVTDMLSMSRIERGGLTIQRGMLNTDWLVAGCLPAMAGAAEAKSIAIEQKMPDNFPVLFADKSLLKIALVNILGNAVKYTPRGGAVTFAIIDNADAVTFEVTDTGIGISQADLPRIFEKYYRAEDPNVANETGTGLGLPMADEIVRLHGGAITVDSKPGKGSRFTIRIPKQHAPLT